jgi:hypothetical protein
MPQHSALPIKARVSVLWGLLAAVLVAPGLSSAGPLPPGSPPDTPPDFEPLPCSGPLTDLIAGSAIDPGQRGFAMNLLGGGLELQGIDLRAVGPCDDSGHAIEPVLTLTTDWRHGASGGFVQVSQRPAEERTADILEAGRAAFWWQGYSYSVTLAGAGPWGGAPGGPLGGTAAALDARPLPRPSHPVPPPVPGGEELLEEAIEALAPGIDLACFYRRTAGGWGDLASVGIGDPRSAVPAGFTESYLALSFLALPAATCPVTPVANREVSFAAAFGSADGGSLSVGAASLPDGVQPAGYLDEWSATWADEAYQYSVGGFLPTGPPGTDLLRALALALDPGFSTACLIETHSLTAAEALALGFRLAVPPAGFVETQAALIAQTASPQCAAPAPPSYFFTWSFSDGADLVIEAGLAHSEGPPVRGRDASTGVSGFSWVDAQGTSYWVYGYSISGGEGPALDLLIQVALSLDPTFDPGSPAGER